MNQTLGKSLHESQPGADPASLPHWVRLHVIVSQHAVYDEKDIPFGTQFSSSLAGKTMTSEYTRSGHRVVGLRAGKQAMGANIGLDRDGSLRAGIDCPPVLVQDIA
jgi:hypothetical protein